MRGRRPGQSGIIEVGGLTYGSLGVALGYSSTSVLRWCCWARSSTPRFTTRLRMPEQEDENSGKRTLEGRTK